MTSSIYTATPAERGEMIAKAKEKIASEGRTVSPTTIGAQLGCSEKTIQRWLSEQGEGARVGVRCRQSADTRKGNLLAAALLVAERDGLHAMTRKAIAIEAFVSVPLVTNYLGKMSHVRKTVIMLAIKHENLTILAQALAINNAYANSAPKELKTRALASLIKG